MKTTLRRLTAAVVLVALLAAVPAAAVWGVLESTPATATDDPVVTGALVLEDEPVEVGEGKNAATVAAGRALGADLQDSELVDWEITSAEAAEDGLADGTYAAAVTVPEDFSADVATAGTSDPLAAEVGLAWGDSVSLASQRAVQQELKAATGDVSDLVSEQQLAGVYSGLDQVDQDLGEAADGAEDVASGSGDLADGAGSARDGAGDLDAGLTDLESATARLASGAGQVDDGADELRRANQSLATGTRKLATSADQAAAGSTRLASGMGALDSSAADLSTAARDVAAGQQQLTTSARQLSSGLHATVADCAASGASPQFCARLTQLAAGSDTLASTSGQLATGGAGVSTGASKLATGTSDAATSARDLAAGNKALATGAHDARDGAAQAARGATSLSEATGDVASGATQVSAGASDASTGAAELDSGLVELTVGADDLAAGSSELATGLRSGADATSPYPEDERDQIASSATHPIADGADDGDRSGLAASLTSSFAPLLAASLAVVVTLAVAVRRRARVADAMLSTRSSARLTVRLLAPMALLGAVHGLAVLAVSAALGIDVAEPWLAAGAAVLTGAALGVVTQAIVAWSPTLAWVGAFLLLCVALMTVTSVVPPGALPSWVGALGEAWPGTWLARATDGVSGGVAWAWVATFAVAAVLMTRTWVGRGRSRPA